MCLENVHEVCVVLAVEAGTFDVVDVDFSLGVGEESADAHEPSISDVGERLFSAFQDGLGGSCFLLYPGEVDADLSAQGGGVEKVTA